MKLLQVGLLLLPVLGSIELLTVGWSTLFYGPRLEGSIEKKANFKFVPPQEQKPGA